LALAALALVVFGAYDSYPKIRSGCLEKEARTVFLLLHGKSYPVLGMKVKQEKSVIWLFL